MKPIPHCARCACHHHTEDDCERAPGARWLRSRAARLGRQLGVGAVTVVATVTLLGCESQELYGAPPEEDSDSLDGVIEEATDSGDEDLTDGSGGDATDSGGDATDSGGDEDLTDGADP